ncbi:MAG: transglycosylase domain-containing protein [Candidatus Thioglobus sp.]|nr:transglycosylase domain-containing protein [Candidatus Thioglobus sp.]
MKWLMSLIVLGIVVFILYLSHLGNIVEAEFSEPLGENYSNLPLYEHPKPLVNMLLLIEDQSYFQHSGVDFKEIIRVLRDRILSDKPIRGASTITQQLIKNALLSRQPTLKRKLKEALMALLLEFSFAKEFILSRYMNSVYLGQQGNRAVYGFANGAWFYFNRPLILLSNDELATLVALVKGPSYYHPLRHRERLFKRKELVLDVFQKHKKIIK